MQAQGPEDRPSRSRRQSRRPRRPTRWLRCDPREAQVPCWGCVSSSLPPSISSHSHKFTPGSDPCRPLPPPERPRPRESREERHYDAQASRRQVRLSLIIFLHADIVLNAPQVVQRPPLAPVVARLRGRGQDHVGVLTAQKG
jgi:hypothetical protein